MKKFFSYKNFLIIFIFFIVVIGFGAVVKYHYDGGKKYQFLQKKCDDICLSATQYQRNDKTQKS